MTDANANAVELVIKPRKRDLGGFTVGRVLPHPTRRMVGPFIFFDEMGPADFAPGTGIDVRPHPHIGLATVTYLFEGELRHKDNLGFDQAIQPGDVNWMTAGRGIVHSERTDAALRRTGFRIHGIQSWIALPESDAEIAPSFHHHPKATLPLILRNGVELRLIAGTAFGQSSPVKTFSPMFYLGVEAQAGAEIPSPDDHAERALYILDGAVAIDGVRHENGDMAVFRPGSRPRLVAETHSRAILLGGAPIGQRLIWWNLVATSQARIETAKRAREHAAETGFKGGVFTLPPGESEFIPLPTE
jgi:hypothetical protein